MKKISTLLVFLALIAGITSPASAAPNCYRKTEVVYTDSGSIEIETTTVIYNTASRNTTGCVDKVQVIKQNGNEIAKVTLSVTFGYDGKTAWVINASGSHTTSDGWSYSGEKITKSGGTATLSAKLTHFGYEDVPVSITLTYSPTGQIS